MGPLALAVFGSRRASDFLWVVLAAVGIALIAPWRGSAGAMDLLGALLALLAGGFWAAYIVLGGRVSRVLPGGQSVATGMSRMRFGPTRASSTSWPARPLTLSVATLSMTIPPST